MTPLLTPTPVDWGQTSGRWCEKSSGCSLPKDTERRWHDICAWGEIERNNRTQRVLATLYRLAAFEREAMAKAVAIVNKAEEAP